MKHLMKYSFLQMMRDTGVMFWALVFPIILGTMFYFAFGNGAASENLEMIPIAVVNEGENPNTESFTAFLKELDGDTLKIVQLDEEKAEKKLLAGDIYGIYTLDKEIKLTVSASGMRESILQSLLDGYNKHAAMIMEIAQTHPERLMEAMDTLTDYKEMTKEVSLGGRTLDTFQQYFFALIAFACMSGAYLGMKTATEMQANITALGARRSVTPTHRMKLVVNDMLVVFGVHFANILILLGYLRFILHIDLGNQWGYILLVCLVGSMVGVALGIFIGSVGKAGLNVKMGLLVGMTLITGFLAGLMMANIKDIIETYCPIVNRLNPAALIADTFYCLTVYDDMARYSKNLITLVVMSVVLIGVGFLLVRRERYDSI